jgi:hypothetical protein
MGVTVPVSRAAMSSKPDGHVLDGIWHHLERLPDDALGEPRARVPLVLAEADELLGILQQGWVRQRVVATGLTVERMDLLGPARAGLEEAERRWIGEFLPGKDEAESLNTGQELRLELLSACRWNLRGEDVEGSLARISDGSDPAELGIDLRELGQLVREHGMAFAGDRTFRQEDVLRRADAAAQQLMAMGECSVSRETRDVRQRAFSFLALLMEELRQAGRHAFRGTREARSLFATDVSTRRRHHPARSLVRATEL